MNSELINKVSNELTEQEMTNVIFYWENNDTDSLNQFNQLVRMGDSKELAIATVLDMKSNSKGESEEMYRGYCI